MSQPDFDWMHGNHRTSRDNTAQTRADEILARARLLAKLGYSKKAAERRLRSNITWEYEQVGKPAIGKRLGKLVTEAYQRTSA